MRHCRRVTIDTVISDCCDTHFANVLTGLNEADLKTVINASCRLVDALFAEQKKPTKSQCLFLGELNAAIPMMCNTYLIGTRQIQSKMVALGIAREDDPCLESLVYRSRLIRCINAFGETAS